MADSNMPLEQVRAGHSRAAQQPRELSRQPQLHDTFSSFHPHLTTWLWPTSLHLLSAAKESPSLRADRVPVTAAQTLHCSQQRILPCHGAALSSCHEHKSPGFPLLLPLSQLEQFNIGLCTKAKRDKGLGRKSLVPGRGKWASWS